MHGRLAHERLLDGRLIIGSVRRALRPARCHDLVLVRRLFRLSLVPI
jgi:hypothetical protein